eukprot:25309_1
MMKQKLTPHGECDTYGSIGTLSNHSSSTTSKNTIANYLKCDIDHLQMHCAAISGILPEYGNTVGDSLIVPYLLELGAPVWTTSYVWVITPFIDSWMQPIYGKLSDTFTAKPNACCKCGGRKPFIILFGIFATIGLVVIPQARNIKNSGQIAAAVIVCILSYTLMDMSHGDLLIPTRALLNDLCHDVSLVKYGNEKFTYYQAIGRCLGYLVVSISWKQIFETHLPSLQHLLTSLNLDHQVSICFTLSIFILWIIILFVVLSTPHQVQRLQSHDEGAHKRTASLDVKYEHYSVRLRTGKNKIISNEMLITPSGRVVILHPSMLITKTITSLLSSDRTYGLSDHYEYDVGGDLSPSFQLTSQHDTDMDDACDTLTPIEPSNDVDVMLEKDTKQPREMWAFPFHFKLYWLIQFFGWCNFAAFSLYFTSFIAIDIYNGQPNTAPLSPLFERFEEGLRAATTMLLVSAIIAALAGKFVIPFLNDRIGVKLVFFSGELMLNILLVALVFGESIRFIFVIVSLYGIAIQIHYNNVFIIIEHDLRHLFKSEHKRAYVLSIFNLCILFANVLVSVFAGWIVHLFSNRFVWGIVFFAMIALLGDVAVYLIFFANQRHHMLDIKYQRKRTMSADNLIVEC